MIDFSDIEIILPAYNEEKLLEENILKLKEFLEKHDFKFVISIVDNASLDNTFRIAQSLEKRFSNIFAFKLEKRGRGHVLRSRILNSSCPVIGYMDIDLPVGLFDFSKIYKEIKKGYDIVIGSRLLPNSSVKRSFIREYLSRVYSRLVRYFLKLPFFDYQCGFKLFKRESITPLVPRIKNNNWFFDTELIFHAYQRGLKIKEVPVTWKGSNRKSKVNLMRTVVEDIKGIWRLRKDT